MVGRELIQQADKTKGRFRTFLLFALNHYVTAVRHKEEAQKRIPKDKLVCLDAVDQMELAETAADLSPEDSFNQAWVSNLLERVLDHVKADCYKDGKSVHWHIFWDRVVAPIMNETAPPSLEDLCHKFGIAETGKASNMIVTVKRRFQSALKQSLRNSVTSEEEMEEELAEIAGFLPRLAQDGEQS
jgi:RNA polymerase sigma-70 factor (ECF subfamily)